MLYSRSFLVIHFRYINAYVSIPNSLTIPLLPCLYYSLNRSLIFWKCVHAWLYSWGSSFQDHVVSITKYFQEKGCWVGWPGGPWHGGCLWEPRLGKVGQSSDTEDRKHIPEHTRYVCLSVLPSAYPSPSPHHKRRHTPCSKSFL